MVTPVENGPAASSRDSEIYGSGGEVATQRSRKSRVQRGLDIVTPAMLGVVVWLLLFTLGVPWVFHIGGLDGLLPFAIIGALLGRTRWRHVPLAAVIVLAFVVVIVAYTSIIAGPAHALIRNDPLPESADAVMVLSAGTNDDGTVSPQSVDRLLGGLELFNRGLAPVLMLSREAYRIGGRTVTSRADQERIVALSPGAMPSLIVAGITHSTHDEALRARDVFRAKGWSRIILVTSPFHTRRACATFEHAGVTVICRASASREMAVGPLWSPTDRIRAFQVWMYETVGWLRYRQLGWL